MMVGVGAQVYAVVWHAIAVIIAVVTHFDLGLVTDAAIPLWALTSHCSVPDARICVFRVITGLAKTREVFVGDPLQSLSKPSQISGLGRLVGRRGHRLNTGWSQRRTRLIAGLTRLVSAGVQLVDLSIAVIV